MFSATAVFPNQSRLQWLCFSVLYKILDLLKRIKSDFSHKLNCCKLISYNIEIMKHGYFSLMFCFQFLKTCSVDFLSLGMKSCGKFIREAGSALEELPLTHIITEETKPEMCRKFKVAFQETSKILGKSYCN